MSLTPQPTLPPDQRAAPHRSFDPELVGSLEALAWVAYYRRRWFAFVRAGLVLARRSFALSWPATLLCSWHALRASQRWAATPVNDPDGARRALARFYTIVQRHYREPFDPDVAAALELHWWQVHRAGPASAAPWREQSELARALARLYAHVYGVAEAEVAGAAALRAQAMRDSDAWVHAGCPDDPMRLVRVRETLVSSYAQLRAAVEVAPQQRRAA